MTKSRVKPKNSIIEVGVEDGTISPKEVFLARLKFLKEYLWRFNWDRANQLIKEQMLNTTVDEIDGIQDKVLQDYLRVNIYLQKNPKKLFFGIDDVLVQMYQTCATDDQFLPGFADYSEINLPSCFEGRTTKEHEEHFWNMMHMITLVNFKKPRKNGLTFTSFKEGLGDTNNSIPTIFGNAMRTLVAYFIENSKWDLKLLNHAIKGKHVSASNFTALIYMLILKEDTLKDKFVLDKEVREAGRAGVEFRDFFNLNPDEKFNVIKYLMEFYKGMEKNMNSTLLQSIYDVPMDQIEYELTEQRKIITQQRKEKAAFLKTTCAGGRKLTAQQHSSYLIKFEERISNAEREIEALNERKSNLISLVWNKSDLVIGLDRNFNIYRAFPGVCHITVSKPRCPNLATNFQEYGESFNPEATMEDELINKISPTTTMVDCEGYDHYYIDSKNKFDLIINQLNPNGCRERKLLANLKKLETCCMDNLEKAELFDQTYEGKTNVETYANSIQKQLKQHLIRNVKRLGENQIKKAESLMNSDKLEDLVQCAEIVVGPAHYKSFSEISESLKTFSCLSIYLNII
uniref:WSD domain-containing protein n=1 Tax=Rhabditophanes sp. KR3021 TaxID=114890 RepID=A0AC35UDC3_9BILA